MIELDEDHDDFREKYTLNGKVHTNEYVSTCEGNKDLPVGSVHVARYKNGNIHSLHSVAGKFFKKTLMHRPAALACFYEGRIHNENGFAAKGYKPDVNYWVIHGINLNKIYDELV